MSAATQVFPERSKHTATVAGKRHKGLSTREGVAARALLFGESAGFEMNED